MIVNSFRIKSAWKLFFFLSLLAISSGQRTQRRPLALHLQRHQIIIRWNLAVWRVIYQSHRGFTSLVWHRCGVEGQELIPPRVWRVRITCTSHLWWPPEWKIQYSVPILPPVVSWPLGREVVGRWNKWEMNKNAFVLAMTLLRILGNKEFIPVWERVAVNLCTQKFRPHACTLAHNQTTSDRECTGLLNWQRKWQIAVEDELVPDRDEKIRKSPKKKKKCVLDVCLN